MSQPQHNKTKLGEGVDLSGAAYPIQSTIAIAIKGALFHMVKVVGPFENAREHQWLLHWHT